MLQAFLCHGKTDETATMLRHEVDRLRRDLFCCQGEVAFVLAILVIHDHNHATGTHLLDRCGNVCKKRVQCHVQLNFSSRGERSRTVVVVAFGSSLYELYKYLTRPRLGQTVWGAK